MAKDIDLLAKNAKTYNEPGSQVFKVSVLLLLFSLMIVDTNLVPGFIITINSIHLEHRTKWFSIYRVAEPLMPVS